MLNQWEKMALIEQRFAHFRYCSIFGQKSVRIAHFNVTDINN